MVLATIVVSSCVCQARSLAYINRVCGRVRVLARGSCEVDSLLWLGTDGSEPHPDGTSGTVHLPTQCSDPCVPASGIRRPPASPLAYVMPSHPFG